MARLIGIINDAEHWFRLDLLNRSGFEEALLAILHNEANDPLYVGLPEDPGDLYTELDKSHRTKLQQLSNRHILKRKQWDKLFPRSQQTNSSEFDITLIVLLIINCTTLPPPNTGWEHHKLAITDNSKAANVLRAREWRNYLSHTSHTEIDAVVFRNKWMEGENIIKGLGSKFDTNSLKTISLDPETSTQQKALIKTLEDFCSQEVKQNVEDINTVKANLDKLDATLTIHDDKLNQQNLAIARQDDRQDQQEVKLSELEKKVVKQDEKRKFHMPLSITRDDLPTDTDRFHYKDIAVDGRLRGILIEAFQQSVKDVTQLEEDKDYEVEDIECSFKSDLESQGKRSEIHFEVVIENAPRFNDPAFRRQISNERMQKSKDLRQKISSKVEAHISSEYNITVEVGFTKWKFGSLVIKGAILLNRGEFAEAQVGDILAIIKTVAANVFETTKPSVRIHTEIKVLNYSIIQLRLGIRLIDQECPNKILEEEELIKEFFKKNIGAVLTKAYSLRLRPSEGTEGRRVQLTTNFFELKIPKNAVIHRYEVILKEGTNFDDFPKKKKRLVIETLVDTNKDVFKHRPVYDGRRCLYTKEPLQLGESNSFFVQIPDGDREQTFEVVLTWSAQVDMTALQASVSSEAKLLLSGLNVVLKHAAALSYVPVRRGFYQRVNVVDLKEGREMWPGFIVTARPTNGWKLVLNVDVSHTIFIKGIDVVEFLKEVTGHDYKKNMPLNDYQRKKFEKEIKGVKIEALHMPYKRKYRVNSVRRDASDKDTFELDDNTRITVSDYFQSKENGKALKYPWLPCLHVGNPERTIYLPLEVCRIVEGQHCNKKLTEEQTALMIKHTALKPIERKNNINRIMNKDLNYPTDRYVKDFGFEVGNQMVSVDGRVLPPPGIVYDVASKPLIPKLAYWSMKYKKLHKVADIKYWGLVVFDNCLSIADATKFEQELRKVANTMGIGMEVPVYRRMSHEHDTPEGIVSDAYQKTRRNKQELKLLVCVLPGKSSIYANLKRLCETQVGHEKLHPDVRHILKKSGLSTQCILRKNAAQAKPVCLAQLLLKINTKMGGTNNNIDKKDKVTRPYRVFEKPVMFMGADVTHPAGGNKTSPSVAAIVGSMDKLPSRYAVTVRVQRNHLEMIEDMKGVTVELLKEFNSKAGRFPERIIMYRDGVSDGQFKKVLYWEMKAIQEACIEIQDKYQPSITFIIVQKRHNTRFFPTDGNMDDSGNCLPGTTIDTGVCHPEQFDYYQFSHAGIQGTSRPTHYHVLWDDSNFTADELQALSYMLCHLYARCTRSVSIPPPAYYAHLVAYRARYHLQEADSEETSSVSSSTISDVGKRIEKMSLHDFGEIAKPHPSMIHEMYFV